MHSSQEVGVSIDDLNQVLIVFVENLRNIDFFNMDTKVVIFQSDGKVTFWVGVLVGVSESGPSLL